MRPTEDQMDALNDTIRRLRSELERLQEAGKAVVECYSMFDKQGLRKAYAALRTALEGEEGK